MTTSPDYWSSVPQQQERREPTVVLMIREMSKRAARTVSAFEPKPPKPPKP